MSVKREREQLEIERESRKREGVDEEGEIDHHLIHHQSLRLQPLAALAPPRYPPVTEFSSKTPIQFMNPILPLHPLYLSILFFL